MNMMNLRFFLFSVLIGILINNKANATSFSSGSLYFSGEIIAETCRIEINNKKMTINMGKISSNQFHSVGEDANPVSFNVHLNDCNTDVSKYVAVSIYGEADSINSNILAIDNSGEFGNANGFGVALFDDENKLIPINEMPKKLKPLDSESIVLHFVAKYRVTKYPISGGKVSSHALLSFVYQ